MRGQLENVIDRLNVINKRHNKITSDIERNHSARSSATQIQGAIENNEKLLQNFHVID